MSNRYYPPTIEDVGRSYEWMIKDKLRELDSIARSMHRDLTMLGRLTDFEIREYMQMQFDSLCEMVAEQEERKERRKTK